MPLVVFVYIWRATMATDDAQTEVLAELNAILSELQNTSKVKRRKALEKLHNLSFESELVTNKSEQGKILDFSLRHLVTCLRDQSEVNRIKASEIILGFIQETLFRQDQLIHLIPAIHHRLATVPVEEESEDVRLQHVKIISSLTTQFEGQMIPYLNDIVNILMQVLLDGRPEVRKAAGECVSEPLCQSYPREISHAVWIISEATVEWPPSPALQEQDSMHQCLRCCVFSFTV